MRGNTILDEEVLAVRGANERFGRCWTGGCWLGCISAVCPPPPPSPPSESQHSLLADSSVKLIGQGERAEEGSVQPH